MSINNGIIINGNSKFNDYIICNNKLKIGNIIPTYDLHIDTYSDLSYSLFINNSYNKNYDTYTGLGIKKLLNEPLLLLQSNNGETHLINNNNINFKIGTLSNNNNALIINNNGDISINNNLEILKNLNLTNGSLIVENDISINNNYKE